jgi:hypothetical protein
MRLVAIQFSKRCATRKNTLFQGLRLMNRLLEQTPIGRCTCQRANEYQ